MRYDADYPAGFDTLAVVDDGDLRDREYNLTSKKNDSPGNNNDNSSRGRSAIRDDSNTRGRSSSQRGTRAPAADDQSTFSKKSNASSGSARSSIALHLRSRSRDERRQYRRSVSRSKSVDGSRRNRSATPSGDQKKSKKYSLPTFRRSGKSRTPSSRSRSVSITRRSRKDDTTTIDDGDNDNNDTVKEAFQTPPPKIGSCFLADCQSIKTWNWKFTLNQLLSGVTIMLAQVPECISYAYIAGIDPFHALQATWIANILSSIVGGRPGMICGPSGLSAIALRFVVTTYGTEYIFYAIILGGICQVVFGALRIGSYLRLLPPGITVGMVNALCCLVILLQLRYFKVLPGMEEEDNDTTSAATSNESQVVSEDSLNQPWAYFLGYDIPWTTSTSQIVIVAVEAFFTLLVCWGIPKCGMRLVPSSLVAIVLVTIVNIGIRTARPDWVVPTVGDYCSNTTEMPSTSMFWKPIFQEYNLPPLSEWTTLKAVIPAGLSLFCINLLETMVTTNVADNYTADDSEQDRVYYGQGVSNIVGGIFGSMSSTGLAHTSLLSLRMDGVTSMSTFVAGIMMLCVIMFAYPAIAVVPLGVIMGVTLDLMLNMIQWTPIVALVLKFIPTRCLASPSLFSWRLSTPDLFSTVVSSIFAICASTYGLAGYFIGSLCYACDPIAYSIVSGENDNRYTLAELKLTKPPAPKTLWGSIRKDKEYEAEEGNCMERDSTDSSPGIQHNDIHVQDDNRASPGRSLFDNDISQDSDSDVENQCDLQNQCDLREW